MNTDIRYIFLDLGGTFRVIREDPDYLAAAKTKIMELCGVRRQTPVPGLTPSSTSGMTSTVPGR